MLRIDSVSVFTSPLPELHLGDLWHMAGRLVSLWREGTYLILLQDAIAQCSWYNSVWINVCGHKEAGDDISAQTDHLLNIKSGETATDSDMKRKNNVLLTVVSRRIKYQNFWQKYRDELVRKENTRNWARQRDAGLSSWCHYCGIWPLY